jgi:predicted nucleic acid-binding protein
VIYVVDASAVIDLLVRSDAGERVRQRLADDAEATLISVAHLDAEAFSGLARLQRAGALTATEVGELLSRLARLDVRRVPIRVRCWRLRGRCGTTSLREMPCTWRPPGIWVAHC